MELLYNLSYLLYFNFKIIFINYLNSHFINKDFILKSYLLAIRPLEEQHLGAYMSKVLIEILKDYNIEFNITR